MRHVSVLAVLMLAGCAGTADCGPDWFSLGQRDGRINAGSQIDRYAARCTSPVDRARYTEGYEDGFYQRPKPMW
jgi:hypothetical protein